MSNIPTGSDTKNAPWNQDEIYCPNCGSDKLELDDIGSYKNIKWENFICMECGYLINNEPDD